MERIMRSHLLKRATVTAVGATMLISVGAACGGDTGGRLVTAGPAEEQPAECLQAPCLGTLGATLGPASPASATGITPECYQAVLDPVDRQYIEAGIVELPGAVMGPARPTCGPDGPAVREPGEPTLAEPDRPILAEPDGPTVVPPAGPSVVLPGEMPLAPL
jgi:hypothetical protein